MAPNNLKPTGILFETDEDVPIEDLPVAKYKKTAKSTPSWPMISLFAYFHIVAIHGLYLVFTSAKIWTLILGMVLYKMGILGTGAGAHRLWSHRAYKAKWQLRLLLTVFQTVAFQSSALVWARDHRVHHKFSETDADPYNARRGFFFSHIGWMLHRKHPEVIAKGQGIDSSDLYADPILYYQNKYYFYIMPIVCFLLPTYLPMHFWNETFANAFTINILRYVLTLNTSLAVNSVAHRWGSKPYDKFLNPSENLTLSILTGGEGWHNYHHTFPWDYRTAEIGKLSNSTSLFIDLMAKIGWAYDLKYATEEMIKKRVRKTGDGSHEIWGWGDKDQTKEEISNAVIKHSKDE